MSTVATPTMHDKPRYAAVRGATARRSVRWAVPIAITLGVFLGAMSCVTGMLAAPGHGAHMAAADSGDDPTSAAHDRHSPAFAAMASPDSSDAGAASSGGDGHPGMACVTLMQLEVPRLVVPIDVRPTGTGLTTAPPDCVTGPEPPVPRFS